MAQMNLHAGWMMPEQETLFSYFPVQKLTAVVSHVPTIRVVFNP